jgi:iron/zinc purple acid phosphatase-like protein C/purple acid phosphatase-like protein/fibronectin type III domain protein
VTEPSELTRRELMERAGVLGVSLASGGLVLAGRAAPARAAIAPPLLVGQGLDDVTAALAWMAVENATAYRLYRDGTLLVEQSGTRYEDASLAPLSGHIYSVSAIVAGSESAQTPAVVRTHAARDAVAPTQPGPIEVTNITASRAELEWGTSTDSVRVVGYRVYRGPASAPPEQLTYIWTTDPTTKSYIATNLRSNTDYKFGVAALDAANNLSQLRTTTFRTAVLADSDPPLPPSSSSVAAVAFSSSRIDLRWGPSASSDVVGYQVLRNGVLIGTVELPAHRTFSDTGLVPSHTYTYTIRTIDSAGNLSAPTSGRLGTTLAAGAVQIPRGPYIQWPTPTSVRIAWWTNLPTASVVQYGSRALDQQVRDSTLRTQHMMLIGGLSAGSQYQYRVGDGTIFSGTFNFRTAAARGSTFSFAAVGDFGGGGPGETDVANAIAAAGTHSVQTVGDNVYPDASDPDFLNYYSDFDSRFYRQYGPVIREQAIWIANGNKEYYGNGAIFRNFWMPNNERWYSYQYGDAHIVVLDSEQPYSFGTPQYQFARKTLSRIRRGYHRIVIIHYPPYSSASAGSSAVNVREHLVPLFETYGVALVLSGNSHNYERTHPLINGEVVGRGGITYIVSGGGGNGHNLFTLPQPEWSAFRNDTDYQFVKVTVSPGSLRVDAIRGDTGAVFDSCTIPRVR